MVRTTQQMEPFRLLSVTADEVSLEVNLAVLPEPADSYFADSLTVRVENRMCTFDFGKLENDHKSLRSRLEIMMSVKCIPELAKSLTNNNFLSKIRTYAKDQGLSPCETTENRAPPDKQHTLAANFATMAYSDADACVAFYRLPPTVHGKIARKAMDQIHIEPVVRIDTTAGTLLRFCDAVEEIAKVEAAK